MVLFAGIAAEALVYGEAEGGENDENLFRNVCLLLEPPLTVIEVSLQLIYPFFFGSHTLILPAILKFKPTFCIEQMSNQARWSVLQSYNLLKWHRPAHRAAVKALESGSSLSVVIRSIEESMYLTK